MPTSFVLAAGLVLTAGFVGFVFVLYSSRQLKKRDEAAKRLEASTPIGSSAPRS